MLENRNYISYEFFFGTRRVWKCTLELCFESSEFYQVFCWFYLTYGSIVIPPISWLQSRKTSPSFFSHRKAPPFFFFWRKSGKGMISVAYPPKRYQMGSPNADMNVCWRPYGLILSLDGLTSKTTLSDQKKWSIQLLVFPGETWTDTCGNVVFSLTAWVMMETSKKNELSRFH